MAYFMDAVKSVGGFFTDFNSATLSGAIDIIVVRRPDGTYHTTPFHVRFGKLQVMKSREQVVSVYVDGKLTNLQMKLGRAGEAFFVEATQDDVPIDLATSPIGVDSPIGRADFDPYQTPSTPLTSDTLAAHTRGESSTPPSAGRLATSDPGTVSSRPAGAEDARSGSDALSSNGDAAEGPDPFEALEDMEMSPKTAARAINQLQNETAAPSAKRREWVWTWGLLPRLVTTQAEGDPSLGTPGTKPGTPATPATPGDGMLPPPPNLGPLPAPANPVSAAKPPAGPVVNPVAAAVASAQRGEPMMASSAPTGRPVPGPTTKSSGGWTSWLWGRRGEAEPDSTDFLVAPEVEEYLQRTRLNEDGSGSSPPVEGQLISDQRRRTRDRARQLSGQSNLEDGEGSPASTGFPDAPAPTTASSTPGASAPIAIKGAPSMPTRPRPPTVEVPVEPTPALDLAQPRDALFRSNTSKSGLSALLAGAPPRDTTAQVAPVTPTALGVKRPPESNSLSLSRSAPTHSSVRLPDTHASGRLPDRQWTSPVLKNVQEELDLDGGLRDVGELDESGERSGDRSIESTPRHGAQPDLELRPQQPAAQVDESKQPSGLGAALRQTAANAVGDAAALLTAPVAAVAGALDAAGSEEPGKEPSTVAGIRQAAANAIGDAAALLTAPLAVVAGAIPEREPNSQEPTSPTTPVREPETPKEPTPRTGDMRSPATPMRFPVAVAVPKDEGAAAEVDLRAVRCVGLDGEIETVGLDRADVLRLSLCRTALSNAQLSAEDCARIFAEHALPYERFAPELMTHAELVYCIDSKYYVSVELPVQTICLIAYNRLPPPREPASAPAPASQPWFRRLWGGGSAAAPVPAPTVGSAPAVPVAPAPVAPVPPAAAETLRKTLRPSNAQLTALNLKPGPNPVRFSVTTRLQGTQELHATIYVWDATSKIIISDIDGTITRSDVLGQVLPMVGRDWSQSGVATLYSTIVNNGYRIVYLSARPIGQATQTRNYIRGVMQNGVKLPDGPVLMSPDRLIQSFTREVIKRRPQEFKIACLNDLRQIFPDGHDCFYAGFGNRVTDTISYRAVGVPQSRIFLINPTGEVMIDTINGFKSSYRKLMDLSSDVFPPLGARATAPEEFNQFNFWSLPIAQFVPPPETTVAKAKTPVVARATSTVVTNATVPSGGAAATVVPEATGVTVVSSGALPATSAALVAATTAGGSEATQTTGVLVVGAGAGAVTTAAGGVVTANPAAPSTPSSIDPDLAADAF